MAFLFLVCGRGSWPATGAPRRARESGRETYNTFAELRKMGYKIYELNEPLKNKPGTSTNDNLQSEMRQAISDGKYHRVDIADLIKQQPSRNILQRLFNKQND